MYKYTIVLKDGTKIEALGELCESIYRRKILSAPILIDGKHVYKRYDIKEIWVEKIENSEV